MFGDMAHLSVLERCTLHIFFSTLQSNLMGYSVPKPSKNNYISGKYHAGVR